MPTVEELQAELAKRDEQIRATTTKLQAHERVLKELGDAVERDAYGNPVRVLVEEETKPPTPKSPMTNSGHPFQQYFGEGDYSHVDAYYQKLIEQQGYLTQKQLEERETAIRQELRGEMMGNIQLFRSLDKTLAHKDYADLGDYKSPRAQRTAQVLQQNGWGRPLEGADAWDKWQYSSLDAIRIAADIAQSQLDREAKAATVSTTTATDAQAASALSATPGIGAAVVPGVKPDFSTMKTPEEIEAGLDAALTAGVST